MIEYLAGHFRYDVMNSWNAATSYARNVKIHKLRFPDNASRNNAYDLLHTPEAFHEVHSIMEAFGLAHDWQWQAAFNGKSSGYIVLYQGGIRQTDHKSVCTSCGQRNFKAVLPPAVTAEDRLLHYLAGHNLWTPEVYPKQKEVKALKLSAKEVVRIIEKWRHPSALIRVGDKLYAQLKDCESSNQCGRCGAHARVSRTFHQVYISPGVGTDGDWGWEDWDTESLRSRTKLVMGFDRMVDACERAFVRFCATHRAEEETYMEPTTRLVAVPA
jgi:hypothetical protein